MALTVDTLKVGLNLPIDYIREFFFRNVEFV